jgi:hypothetical protein
MRHCAHTLARETPWAVFSPLLFPRTPQARLGSQAQSLLNLTNLRSMFPLGATDTGPRLPLRWRHNRSTPIGRQRHAEPAYGLKGSSPYRRGCRSALSAFFKTRSRPSTASNSLLADLEARPPLSQAPTPGGPFPLRPEPTRPLVPRCDEMTGLQALERIAAGSRCTIQSGAARVRISPARQSPSRMSNKSGAALSPPLSISRAALSDCCLVRL